MKKLLQNTEQNRAALADGDAAWLQDDKSAPCHDYEKYFEDHYFSCSHYPPYLLIGKYPDPAGACWQIYISVVRQQMTEMMAAILPDLQHFSQSFRMPQSSNVHALILEGGLGYEQVGKIITMYVQNDEKAVLVAEAMIRATANFMGPSVPEARHLGNCVYVKPVKGLSGDVINEPGGINRTNRSSWPFGDLCTERLPSYSRWLNSKYFVVQNLKSDVKGNVYKVIDFSRLLNIQWRVIKQGKCNHCADDAGRTIKDRLLWQYEVQTELSGLVPLPKAIDFFERDGDSYLVMEFIDGVSLLDRFNALQQGTIWQALDIKSQTGVIHYLLKALEIISSFHQQGYLHRDITPVNFVLDTEDRMFAIDIELCCNYRKHRPSPVFTLGTPGYMSPAQEQGGIPEAEDDIYGFGALLLKAFTGLSPVKFKTEHPDDLYASVVYFTGSHRMAAVIIACLDPVASLRPCLASLKHSLELYYSILLTENAEARDDGMINNEALGQNISAALKAIWALPQKEPHQPWHSRSDRSGRLIANEFKSRDWMPGFHKGNCGVLYTLTVADLLGYCLDENADEYYLHFEHLRKYYSSDADEARPGLYHGSAGFCVLMAFMIHHGYLERSITHVNYIARLLAQPNEQLNVADGIAGQGLAILQCSDLLSFPELAHELVDIASVLIKAQQRDGSWKIKKDGVAKDGVKLTGFMHGIAGITYFLLEFSARFQSPRAEKAACKSLGWLLDQRRESNGHLLWSLNSQKPVIDPWLEYGFSGVALVFIKAFELLKEPAYKIAATDALLSHPACISSNYLTQANGLAGLGEVYMEAHQVFGEQEWLNRALHIATFLEHSSTAGTVGNRYWLEGSDSMPTADFMAGNSGIIHFVLRCQRPTKIRFPLISIKN